VLLIVVDRDMDSAKIEVANEEKRDLTLCRIAVHEIGVVKCEVLETRRFLTRLSYTGIL
jgi:hypothetical protein